MDALEAAPPFPQERRGAPPHLYAAIPRGPRAALTVLQRCGKKRIGGQVTERERRPVWVVLRTKPKQERHVLEGLAARGIEGYCPRILEPPRHRTAPRGPVPLFPSYVFARCVLKERYAAVHYCPGAVGVVRFGDEVAVLDDAVVAALRQREGERGYVVVQEVRRHPARGEAVRIVAGPLAGLEGVVQRYLPGRDRVRLLLRVVRGVRHVEVDASHLRSAR